MGLSPSVTVCNRVAEKSFKDIVSNGKLLPLIYMGDESLDEFVATDLPRLERLAANPDESLICMQISLYDYKQLWRPWQKALIIKILGQ